MTIAPTDIPLFDELWDYNDPASTEQRLRELLPQVEAGKDKNRLAQLLTQIARTHSLRRQFDLAHNLLDQVETMLTADWPVARIRYWLERGRCYNSAGEKAAARPFFQQAFQLAEAIGADFYAIDAAHMLAIAELAPQDQMAWNRKALALAEQTSNQRARQWQGSLTNNIGWTYFSSGDYENGLLLFQKALHWQQYEAEPRQEDRIRLAKWCVGRVRRALGQVAEALALQQTLLAELEAIGEVDGHVFEEIAECYLLLEQPDAARPFFSQAYELLAADAWLIKHEPERLARLQQLGQL